MLYYEGSVIEQMEAEERALLLTSFETALNLVNKNAHKYDGEISEPVIHTTNHEDFVELDYYLGEEKKGSVAIHYWRLA